MLKEVFGQPAHPMVVHFPVALFVLSALLLVLHRVDGKAGRVNRVLEKIKLGRFDFESFSFFALLGGVAGGLAAIFSGVALVEGWKNLPTPHAPLGIGTVLCYSVLLLIRWGAGPRLSEKRIRFLYYGLTLMGLVLLGLAGFEGGGLHYGKG